MKHYVYELRDPHTGEPMYVGVGQGKRIDDHYRMAECHQNVDLGAALVALGTKPDAREVQYFATRREAFAFERVLIAKYGRRDLGTGPLYNRHKGGSGGYVWAAKHKSDPEFAERVRAKGRALGLETWADTELTGRLLAGVKAYHVENKEVVRERARKQMATHNTPARRAASSAHCKAVNADAAYTAKRLAAIAAFNADPIRAGARMAKLRTTVNQPGYQEAKATKYKATTAARPEDWWDTRTPASEHQRAVWLKASAKRKKAVRRNPKLRAAELAKARARDKARYAKRRAKLVARLKADPVFRAAHAARVKVANAKQYAKRKNQDQ
jgi:hypothetical protein